ncbi:MAG: hypothetical protein IJL87_06390 [Clostridia bacterium]|nr:hypothetical protein [Clostridia bacterium]
MKDKLWIAFLPLSPLTVCIIITIKYAKEKVIGFNKKWLRINEKLYWNMAIPILAVGIPCVLFMGKFYYTHPTLSVIILFAGGYISNVWASIAGIKLFDRLYEKQECDK